MLIYNIKKLSITFEALMNVSLLQHMHSLEGISVRDNTCTQKSYLQILTPHNKAFRHTYNSLVWPTIVNSPFWLLMYVKDKDCTNY